MDARLHLMNPYDQAIEDYASRSTREVDQVFRDLKEETYAKMSNPGMQVGEVEGTFLRFLVAMTGAKRVLEFGTFTGYSAMMMASALPPKASSSLWTVILKAVDIAKKVFCPGSLWKDGSKWSWGMPGKRFTRSKARSIWRSSTPTRKPTTFTMRPR